jgi:hypothetical protein
MMDTAKESTRFPLGGWRDREERRDPARHSGSRDPWTFGSKEEEVPHRVYYLLPLQKVTSTSVVTK